ncbi:hypothetical protein MLD38_034043 [Melastoma candidum]|uniref:Uncharacterized protein n=1 Tax=Melastoma candidum TaxID=119954 RepID=A0ACB9M8H2_9MYRT|nr:hypothetical protein MLD38_034043 [Melastoma candidum]
MGVRPGLHPVPLPNNRYYLPHSFVYRWIYFVVSHMVENNCSVEIVALARGLNDLVRRFNGFTIAGYRFHMKKRERLHE